jgi:putative tryptophan/tyrosine transport system substrate-binding protein
MVSMRRREFIILFGGAAAGWPLLGHAQQPVKMRRIGYLDYGAGVLPSGGFAPFHDTYRRKPFLEGLRELGWVEGQNVTIERRFAAGQANRLPALAAELVALNVDVMLAAATPAAKAAQDATSRIAIVMADPGDAVQLGLVASLARPGANITGVTSLAPELATKRLALLKEAFPKTARVAVLWNSAIPPAEVALKELRAAAPALGVDLQFVEVPGPPGFAEAFAAIMRERADALFVFPDPSDIRQQRIDHRLRQQEFDPRSVRRTGVCGGRRPDVLWIGLPGHVPACRQLCGSHSQWSEPCRSSRRATRQVRADHQPQNCEGIRFRYRANAARPRRRGGRVTPTVANHFD